MLPHDRVHKDEMYLIVLLLSLDVSMSSVSLFVPFLIPFQTPCYAMRNQGIRSALHEQYHRFVKHRA